MALQSQKVHKSSKDNRQGASLHLFSSNNVSYERNVEMYTLMSTALVCVVFNLAGSAVVNGTLHGPA